jgi:hypothetical protein
MRFELLVSEAQKLVEQSAAGLGLPALETDVILFLDRINACLLTNETFPILIGVLDYAIYFFLVSVSHVGISRGVVFSFLLSVVNPFPIGYTQRRFPWKYSK